MPDQFCSCIKNWFYETFNLQKMYILHFDVLNNSKRKKKRPRFEEEDVQYERYIGKDGTNSLMTHEDDIFRCQLLICLLFVFQMVGTFITTIR